MDYRRKYPTELQGGKNEWKGLIKHQNEIKDELS